jgi:uncharacterized protein YdeI (YjbR/CyaY-like superfamily)
MLHPKDNRPIESFKTAKDFEVWLKKNHKTAEGMWVRFYKKDSGVDSITYPQAVEVALCYGWIDAVMNKYDEQSYIQRFTPRRSKSIWSKINIDKVTRLIEEGRMKPAGLKEIEAAKADGRWQAAYDSPSNTIMPEDFLLKLSKNAKAKKFFDTLNKSNTYAIAWRLQTAKKPETREKRMNIILEMLSKGEKFH